MRISIFINPILFSRTSSCSLQNQVSTKMTIFWDAALCNPVKVQQCFRGICCLHHQGNDDVFTCVNTGQYLQVCEIIPSLYFNPT
jgi:hypothetical protein